MTDITASQTLCKQPSEKRKFEMQFTNLLTTGETVTGVFEVRSELIGGGPTDLTITGETVESSNKVTMWIAGGTHAQRYRVEVVVGTSGGAILEGDGILKVSDK
jgi:hypothetical protein